MVPDKGVFKRKGSDVWQHRVCVPADVRSHYGGKDVLPAKSLGTKDLAAANREARKRIAAAEAEFEAKRAASVTVSVAVSLGQHERRRLCDAYYARRLDEEPLRRRDLLKRTRADEAAFWRGEIVPTPGDAGPIGPHHGRSFWDDVLRADPETKLEDAFLYAVDFDQRTMAADLARRHTIGDCDGFLAIAAEMAPDAAEPDKEKLALALMLAELKALTDLSSKDDARIREITGRSVDEAVTAPRPAPIRATALANAVPTLQAASARWLDEHRVLGKETLDKARQLVEMMCELCGHKAIDLYTAADARAVKDALRILPSGWMKRPDMRHMTVTQAVAEAKRLGLPPQSDTTSRYKLNMLRRIWAWIGSDYSDAHIGNPFGSVTIAKPRNAVASEERDPFSPEALHAMFAFLLKPRPKNAQAAQLKWLCAIGLVTGARLGELCQLKRSDVMEHDGVTFVRFAPPMQLKNAASERSVPLHADVFRLGFRDYLSDLEPDSLVFPFKRNEHRPSFAAGRAFNRWLEKSGIKTQKTNFHSFRHSWTDIAARSGMDYQLRERLIGHTLAGEASRYGSGYRAEATDMALLKVRNDAVQRMTFECLAEHAAAPA